MPIQRRPSSLDGIKRLAKAIKAGRGISHHAALEASAKQSGYENYTHARRRLDSGSSPIAATKTFPERPQGGNDDHEGFLERCRQAWVETLDRFNPALQKRLTYEGPTAIRRILEAVLAHTRSHAHLPPGGGHDFSDVRASRESGCVEFQVKRGAVYIARPKLLILEHVAQAPSESFLLLELGDLAPSGAYEPADDLVAPDLERLRRREEVVELSPSEYVDRYIWDQGHLGYDQDDREIPLPKGARLIVRWFNGKMLFVTKGSMWNGTPATYDGRHDRMSVDDIRAMIDRSLPSNRAAE